MQQISIQPSKQVGRRQQQMSRYGLICVVTMHSQMQVELQDCAGCKRYIKRPRPAAGGRPWATFAVFPYKATARSTPASRISAYQPSPRIGWPAWLWCAFAATAEKCPRRCGFTAAAAARDMRAYRYTALASYTSCTNPGRSLF
jgi:hypothetical protein